MTHRVQADVRTEKWASITRPSDGWILGDLRHFVSRFDDLADDAEIELRVRSELIVDGSLSVKAIDEGTYS